jgi:hypothetical protein
MLNEYCESPRAPIKFALNKTPSPQFPEKVFYCKVPFDKKL